MGGTLRRAARRDAGAHASAANRPDARLLHVHGSRPAARRASRLPPVTRDREPGHLPDDRSRSGCVHVPGRPLAGRLGRSGAPALARDPEPAGLSRASSRRGAQRRRGRPGVLRLRVTRLAVLGGSAVSTPQLATALADEGVSIHVALAGRAPEKLDLVAEAFRRAADGTLEVSAHTDPASALEGADLVLIQVRIGGLESRSFDERYARDLGIPGEETVGPGGFALAWRTLPALAELFEVCREVAPTASVVNLSNPAGMVHGSRLVSYRRSPCATRRSSSRSAPPRFSA